MENKIKANFFVEQIRQVHDLCNKDMVDDDVNIIYSVIENDHIVYAMHADINSAITIVMKILEAIYHTNPDLCLSEIFTFVGKAVEEKL